MVWEDAFEEAGHCAGLILQGYVEVNMCVMYALCIVCLCCAIVGGESNAGKRLVRVRVRRCAMNGSSARWSLYVCM